MSSKPVGKTWGEQIKGDIQELQKRVTLLEHQVQNIIRESRFGGGASGVTGKQDANTPLNTSLAGLKQMGDTGRSSIREDIEDIKEYNQQLQELSYTIRMVTTAIRGYLMLVREAGLVSDDEKDIVRRLETAQMSIMKLMNAIQLADRALFLLEAGHPYFAVIHLIAAGGAFAASLAFANRTSGGTV